VIVSAQKIRGHPPNKKPALKWLQAKTPQLIYFQYDLIDIDIYIV